MASNISSTVIPESLDELMWFNHMQIARAVAFGVLIVTLLVYSVRRLHEYIDGARYPHLNVDPIDEQGRTIFRATLNHDVDIVPEGHGTFKLEHYGSSGPNETHMHNLPFLVNLADTCKEWWQCQKQDEPGIDHVNKVRTSLPDDKVVNTATITASDAIATKPATVGVWRVTGRLLATWTGQFVLILYTITSVEGYSTTYLTQRTGWFDILAPIEVYSAKWDLAAMCLYYIAAAAWVMELVLLTLMRKHNLVRMYILWTISLFTLGVAQFISHMRMGITWYQLALDGVGMLGVILILAGSITEVLPAQRMWKEYKEILHRQTSKVIHSAYIYMPLQALIACIAQKRINKYIILLGIFYWLLPHVLLECQHGEHRCDQVSRVCVTFANRCDGHVDCNSMLDEWGCDDELLQCYAQPWCYLPWDIKDGKEDCLHGTDESNGPHLPCTMWDDLVPRTAPVTTPAIAETTLLDTTTIPEITTAIANPSTVQLTTNVNSASVTTSITTLLITTGLIATHTPPLITTMFVLTASANQIDAQYQFPNADNLAIEDLEGNSTKEIITSVRHAELTVYAVHTARIAVWGVVHEAQFQPVIAAIQNTASRANDAALIYFSITIYKNNVVPYNVVPAFRYALQPVIIYFFENKLKYVNYSACAINYGLGPDPSVVLIVSYNISHIKTYTSRAVAQASYLWCNATDNLGLPLSIAAITEIHPSFLQANDYRARLKKDLPRHMLVGCGNGVNQVPCSWVDETLTLSLDIFSHGCIICLRSGSSFDLSSYKKQLEAVGVNVSKISSVVAGLSDAVISLAKALISTLVSIAKKLNRLSHIVQALELAADVYRVREFLVQTFQGNLAAIIRDLVHLNTLLGTLTFYAQSGANVSLPIVQEVLHTSGDAAAKKHALLAGYNKYSYLYALLEFTPASILKVTQYYKFQDTSVHDSIRDITFENFFPINGTCAGFQTPLRLYADLTDKRYIIGAANEISTYLCEQFPCKQVFVPWRELKSTLARWLASIPNNSSIAYIDLPQLILDSYIKCENVIAQIYFSTNTRRLHVYTLEDCTISLRGATTGHHREFETKKNRQFSVSLDYSARIEITCPSMRVELDIPQIAPGNFTITPAYYPSMPLPDVQHVNKSFFPVPTVAIPTLPPGFIPRVEKYKNESDQIKRDQDQTNKDILNLSTQGLASWVVIGVIAFFVLILIIQCCRER